MHRKLFPELAQAYEDWALSGSRDALRHLAEIGRTRRHGMAQELLALHRRHGEQVGTQIETRIDSMLQ